MSRDINDPEIKVNIRTSPNSEEEKKDMRSLNSNPVSTIMGNLFASLLTRGTYRNGDDDYIRPGTNPNLYGDVSGYASLQGHTHLQGHAPLQGHTPLQAYIHVSDSFGDGSGFYSDIPYLLQAMTIIEPENFTHKNPSIVLDLHTRKCSKSEISKECAVCLEKIKEDDIITTIDCAHTFHYSCITEWGKYKQECPLCRTRIPILEI